MGRHSEDDDAAAKAVAKKSTLRQAPAQHVDYPPAAVPASSSQPRTTARETTGRGRDDDVEDDMTKAKWSAVAQAPATFEDESKEDEERMRRTLIQEKNEVNE